MSISQKLQELIDAGSELNPNSEYYWAWVKRVTEFLRAVGLNDQASKVETLYAYAGSATTGQGSVLGFLEGVLAAKQEEPAIQDESRTAKSARSTLQPVDPKRVFVVHGHDTEAKEVVARFLDRIGLEPVILHEQPNAGLTVVEKFEAFSNVGFAVVLLTPDDVGAAASDQTNLQPAHVKTSYSNSDIS